MSTMTRSEIKAFMRVLKAMNLREETAVGITSLMEDETDKADEMVEFIKNNQNATETELINKALEINQK